MAAATGPALSTPLRIRRLDLAWGCRTYVMAILNVTPDSFSGDGLGHDLSQATVRARQAVEAGADLLDVGGESTRPGAEPVAAAEEIARVVPVIRALRDRLDVPISIDTSKAVVAEAALDAGADLVNDVWAFRADPAMADLVARRRVPVILMHNRMTPDAVRLDPAFGAHYAGVDYDDLLADVGRELMSSVAHGRAAGVADQQVILDPGLGFGKTPEQSLTLLNRLDELRALGFPILAGPSRKSFLGKVLGGVPPTDRVEGTAAAVAVAIARGADIVRVHDVLAMVRVARVTDAIVRV
jgi:dihydropteroate synthase